MSSNSKRAKRQGNFSNDKQVEVASRQRRGTEEDEKEEPAVSVTRQLCIKPIENDAKLDKEVVLQRIHHRKRVNKVRATVGAFLSSLFSTNTDKGKGKGNASSVQEKKWVDDAFAAL